MTLTLLLKGIKMKISLITLELQRIITLKECREALSSTEMTTTLAQEAIETMRALTLLQISTPMFLSLIMASDLLLILAEISNSMTKMIILIQDAREE